MQSLAPSRTVRYICKACRNSLNRARSRPYGTNQITSNPTDIYDVVIVGGGPVGLALLTAIKSSPTSSHLKCALIESQALPKQKTWDLPPTQYSNRASSITPTNESFLDAIGAWRHLDLSRIQPYNEMQVWDASNTAAIQFDWQAEATRYNAPLRTVATMTENANLSRALLRRIAELGSEGCLLSGTSVQRIDNGVDDADGLNLTSWPVLSLTSSSNSAGSTAARSPPSSTRRIAARLLVGADGINSPVRAFAGIGTNGWDYDRHGVVATLELEPDSSSQSTTSPAGQSDDFDQALDDFLSDEDSPTNETKNKNVTPSNKATAYQRFLPSLGGPIAILPLPNNHASLVWSTTPQIASYLKSLSAAAFTATVNAALRLDQVDIKYMLSLPSTTSSTTSDSTSDSTSKSSPSSSISSSPAQKQKQYSHADELHWRLSHTTPTPSPRSHAHDTPLSPPRIRTVQPGTVASFPLRLRNATAYTGPRIALAGDAAHTIHPLAGQGLNLGLGDAAALAGTIEHAVGHGVDLGDAQALTAYSRLRYGRAVEMAGGVDALNWLYQLGGDREGRGEAGIVSELVGRVRGWGMSVINGGWVPGLKEGIMRRAD